MALYMIVHCCALPGVEALELLLAHKLGEYVLNLGHPCATAHQDDLLFPKAVKDIWTGPVTLLKACRKLQQLVPVHGLLDIDVLHQVLYLGKALIVCRQYEFNSAFFGS